MSGVKQFDVETVVDRAMHQFWRSGFTATSMQDLERVTKLRRGSLYNAFGDKEALFIAALKRYDTTIGSKRTEPLRNPNAYQAVDGFLKALVKQLAIPGRPRGCLHTNTSLEIPGVPRSILAVISERTAAIEAAIYSALLAGKRKRQIDPSADLRATARFYLAVAKGITVLHKVQGDSDALKAIVPVAMGKWPEARSGR